MRKVKRQGANSPFGFTDGYINVVRDQEEIQHKKKIHTKNLALNRKVSGTLSGGILPRGQGQEG